MYDASPPEPIQVPMTPMKECRITIVDSQKHAVAAVRVASWPNVGWWNGGSQVYCHPLYKSEDLIRHRAWSKVIRMDDATPFEGSTGVDGRVTLSLPGRWQLLTTDSDKWELPAIDRSRSIRIELKPDGVEEKELVVQPRGTDRLGD